MKFPLTKCRNILGTRNIGVDFLAIMFGIGSWIGVNSMYLQLPLFVANAPEGWSLPSYLVIVIQIGNIGPLAYTLFQKYSPRKLKDAYMIYGIYIIGIAATLCMAFLHQITAFVAGQERSVALLAITFFCAFIGCTSSVLFMPYMGRFQEIYLITYLVGEGLSGFLPSILALIQGVGGNPECIPNESQDGPEFTMYSTPPRFDTRVFFIFVFVLMCLSALGFVFLHKLKMCKKEYAKVTIKDGNDYNYMQENDKRTESVADDGLTPTIDGKVIDGKVENSKKISPMNYLYLMLVMAVVSMFGSGIFPGLQSYSCLPYGNLAYHLTVTLSSIANPLACFLAVFLPHKSIRHITVLMLLMIVISCYALATAVLSPSPPLMGTAIGEAIVVSF